MSMDKLPDREGISTAPVPEGSMRGESDTPAGGEQTSQDTVAQARIDCRAAFDRGLAGAKPAPDAVNYFDELFNRTVKYAIEKKGFKWKDKGTEIALQGMKKIAALAKADANGKEVPLACLKPRAKAVIKDGKGTCTVKAAAGFDAIFCVLYAPDGTYRGSETVQDGAGDEEGAPRGS